MLRFEHDPRLAKLMEEDLRWSIKDMDSKVRGRALSALAATHIYKDVDPEDRDAQAVFAALDMWLSADSVREVDVAIVAVKEVELDAVKSAFGVPLTQREDHYVNGAYFFMCEAAQPGGRPPLKVVITMAGRSGNDTMAAFLATVFTAFSARLCCLVGMAAGDEEQVSKGDVLFGLEVVDFKRKIMTDGGEELDPKPLAPSQALIRDFSFFRPERMGWHELTRQTIFNTVAEFSDIVVPVAFDPATYCPGFKRTRIMAADELIEDDSISVRAALAGPARRTSGAEMEGSGFAVGCSEWGVPWLVMRGIADYGRREQDSRPKDWQFVSTVAAAACLRTWLESSHFMAPR
ncbi:hypothetical protein [Rhizocola hellebori]|nr:hypothetical protein [Rhizocola hellebori]